MGYKSPFKAHCFTVFWFQPNSASLRIKIIGQALAGSIVNGSKFKDCAAKKLRCEKVYRERVYFEEVCREEPGLFVDDVAFGPPGCWAVEHAPQYAKSR